MPKRFKPGSPNKLPYIPNFEFSELCVSVTSENAGVPHANDNIANAFKIFILRIFYHSVRNSETAGTDIANLEQGSNQMFKLVFERLESLETENYPVIPRKKLGI